MLLVHCRVYSRKMLLYGTLSKMPLAYSRNTSPKALSRSGLSSLNNNSQFSFKTWFMVSPTEKRIIVISTWRHYAARNLEYGGTGWKLAIFRVTEFTGWFDGSVTWSAGQAGSSRILFFRTCLYERWTSRTYFGNAKLSVFFVHSEIVMIYFMFMVPCIIIYFMK